MWENGLFQPGTSLDRYGIVAAPAAGANYSQVSPIASARYQLIAMAFDLTTSADVADRLVQLVWSFEPDGLAAQEMIVAQAGVVQPGSTTVRYIVGPGYADSAAIVNGRVLIRLPYPLELWLSSGGGGAPGWYLSSDVDNLDNTDQLGQLHFYYRAARGGST